MCVVKAERVDKSVAVLTAAFVKQEELFWQDWRTKWYFGYIIGKANLIVRWRFIT